VDHNSRLRNTIENKFPYLATLYRLVLEAVRPHRIHKFKGLSFFDVPSEVKARNNANEPAIFLKMVHGFDVVIDIGANIGFYTMLAALDLHRLVFSFEPTKRNFRFLKRNIEKNELSNRDRIFLSKLAITDGAKTLNIYGDGRGASAIQGWSGMLNRPTQIYNGSSLDNLFVGKFVNKSLFLKIDVEGYEYSVICGAISLLKEKALRALWIEIIVREESKFPNTKWSSTLTLLLEIGYHCYAIELRQIVNSETIDIWIREPSLLQSNSTFLVVNDYQYFQALIIEIVNNDL
jgi:FkbM family methyltransferase